MKKDVIISIKRLQQSQGETQDPITLVTAGRYYRKNGSYYISYEETELTGLEGTRTTLRIKPNAVRLVRTGLYPSELVFEQGKRHMSLYSTPYGNMEIGVRARRLNSTLELTGGRLEIDYDIEINHMLAGQSLFRIDVRENTPVKS